MPLTSQHNTKAYLSNCEYYCSAEVKERDKYGIKLSF